MSTGFDIVISPSDSVSTQPVEFFARTLRLVLESTNVRKNGLKLVAYREQRPANYGVGNRDPHVMLQKESSFTEICKNIAEMKEKNIYLGVTCTYDRLRWNNEICDSEPSRGWLVVEYEAPHFALGYNSRMRGSHRIHFDNINYFGLPRVDLGKCDVNSPEALSKMVRYGSNYRFVENLLKDIVSTFSPEALIVVTEGAAVDPADFHMVYHNQISKYLFDAKKMLQLYRYGGGYFYEGRIDEFDLGYKSRRPKGELYLDDIRNTKQARELVDQLDLYSTLLGTSALNEITLTDEEILDVIVSCAKLESEVIGAGLYVTSSRGLFGYLDLIYQRLLDRLVSKSIGHSD